MNRSEELAKLLGIKPKKEIAMHCGTNCNRHNCIMDRDCEHYKPIGAYPNFTKPDNFVKLLNLVYKCGINQKCDFQLASLSFEYDDNSIWIDEVEEIKISFENVWIECLKTKLQTNNPDSWDINFANIIKQQAQQTEWTY